jgi:hypothetical protein
LNEANHLPQPDRDRPLIAACHDLAQRIRTGGPDGEIDEWSIYDESLRRLVRWAEETGCFHEKLQPLKEGGREHDLTFVEERHLGSSSRNRRPQAMLFRLKPVLRLWCPLCLWNIWIGLSIRTSFSPTRSHLLVWEVIA